MTMTAVDPRLARFWRDPSMFGTTLLIMFLDVYTDDDDKTQQDGPKCLRWQPETVEMEIRQDFGVDIPDAAFDRLMTALSILTTNSFFRSPSDFARACVVLSGHRVNPNTMILPDCADIAWGMTEGLFISSFVNPPDRQEPFSTEIAAFVGACVEDEGMLNPPDVLRMGLRNNKIADNALYSYSDDPELFSAIQGVEEGKTNDINHLVKGRMRALLLQLKELPVAAGAAARVAEKLLAGLPGDEALPLPG